MFCQIVFFSSNYESCCSGCRYRKETEIRHSSGCSSYTFRLNFTNLVLKWHFLYQVHMIRSQSMAVTLFIFPCQSTYSDWCPECQSVTQGSKYSDYLNCINYQRLFTLHKLSACNGIEIYQVQSN